MIAHLIRKEFTIELRRKSVLGGIGLYLISLVFICYLTFHLQHHLINKATWSVLFWLVILFSTVNSVAKSFIGERTGTSIYLYTVASPQAIILSKIIYNALHSFLLAVTGYLFFILFINDPVQDHLIFIIGLALTAIGFATSLTLIASLAAKANNSHVVMAVLSFPVLIAILLMAIKVTKNALDGLGRASSTDEILNLTAINLISVTLAYILFPYIWRS